MKYADLMAQRYAGLNEALKPSGFKIYAGDVLIPSAGQYLEFLLNTTDEGESVYKGIIDSFASIGLRVNRIHMVFEYAEPGRPNVQISCSPLSPATSRTEDSSKTEGSR